MEPVRIPITRLRPNAHLPAYQSAHAAGMDLAACLDEPLHLAPGDYRLVPCGIAVAIPEGFEGQVRPRSGLAAKHGVTVLNSPGTIDSDYRGEVKVVLVNHGRDAFRIDPGMRIAQLIIAPVTRATWAVTDTLPDTPRGTGGFGHTGLGAEGVAK
jgi:dUTP pyrophosphatase